MPMRKVGSEIPIRDTSLEQLASAWSPERPSRAIRMPTTERENVATRCEARAIAGAVSPLCRNGCRNW